ncbi:MAG: hypothetical protein ACTHMI_08725 [Mucilaginibacter sp.]
MKRYAKCARMSAPCMNMIIAGNAQRFAANAQPHAMHTISQ